MVKFKFITLSHPTELVIIKKAESVLEVYVAPSIQV